VFVFLFFLSFFLSSVDNDWIPKNYLQAFQAGEYNQMPIIIGDVSDEGLMFVWQVSPYPVIYPEYAAILTFIFGIETAFDVAEIYEAPAFGDARDVLDTLVTEYMFICVNKNITKSWINYGNPNVWVSEVCLF
jgi:carboxylesterase type B